MSCCNDSITLPGSQGPTGATGATGPAGSQIYTGAGVPSDVLGVNGDLYIDTDAPYNFYTKSGGTWL